MTKYEFVDHLQEYMRGLVTRYVEEHKDTNTMPPEFKGIPDNRLIELLTDQATPILRKIEGEALDAGIGRMATLIRYSQKQVQ